MFFNFCLEKFIILLIINIINDFSSNHDFILFHYYLKVNVIRKLIVFTINVSLRKIPYLNYYSNINHLGDWIF